MLKYHCFLCVHELFQPFSFCNLRSGKAFSHEASWPIRVFLAECNRWIIIQMLGACITGVYQWHTVLRSCGIWCRMMSKCKKVKMLKNVIDENKVFLAECNRWIIIQMLGACITGVYEWHKVLRSCGIWCGKMSKCKMVKMLKNAMDKNKVFLAEYATAE
jgi:hypothetical protein